MVLTGLFHLLLCNVFHDHILHVLHDLWYRLEMWKKNNYISLSLSYDEDDDDNTTTESEDDIKYVIGDVTQPQCTESGDAIVVHCVGECGVIIKNKL